MTTRISHACASILLAASCAAASADPIDDIVGDYELVSAKTVPDSTWGYAKARIAIRRLDAAHVSIVLACGWRDIPKSVCGERFFARLHNGGMYLQDQNTSGLRMAFDQAAHRLTIVSRGLDAARSVRYEVYQATTAPLTDADLLRRMRKEQRYMDEEASPQQRRRRDALGFSENPIAFQTGS